MEALVIEMKKNKKKFCAVKNTLTSPVRAHMHLCFVVKRNEP